MATRSNIASVIGSLADNSNDSDESDKDEDDNKEENEHIEGDTGLKVYDAEREVMRIDNENNNNDDDNDDNDYLSYHYDENDDNDENKNYDKKLTEIIPRSVTNQHVYEWLQLIGQQIIPSKSLITKNKIYNKEDIVLYEDDDIMVINKPPNIAVHPTFATGCD